VIAVEILVALKKGKDQRENAIWIQGRVAIEKSIGGNGAVVLLIGL